MGVESPEDWKRQWQCNSNQIDMGFEVACIIAIRKEIGVSNPLLSDVR